MVSIRRAEKFAILWIKKSKSSEAVWLYLTRDTGTKFCNLKDIAEGLEGYTNRLLCHYGRMIGFTCSMVGSKLVLL